MRGRIQNSPCFCYDKFVRLFYKYFFPLLAALLDLFQFNVVQCHVRSCFDWLHINRFFSFLEIGRSCTERMRQVGSYKLPLRGQIATHSQRHVCADVMWWSHLIGKTQVASSAYLIRRCLKTPKQKCWLIVWPGRTNLRCTIRRASKIRITIVFTFDTFDGGVKSFSLAWNYS